MAICCVAFDEELCIIEFRQGQGCRIHRNRSGDQSPQFFSLKSIWNSDLEKTHPDLRSAEANTVDPENLAGNIPSIRKNVMMLEIDKM